MGSSERRRAIASRVLQPLRIVPGPDPVAPQAPGNFTAALKSPLPNRASDATRRRRWTKSTGYSTHSKIDLVHLTSKTSTGTAAQAIRSTTKLATPPVNVTNDPCGRSPLHSRDSVAFPRLAAIPGCFFFRLVTDSPVFQVPAQQKKRRIDASKRLPLITSPTQSSASLQDRRMPMSKRLTCPSRGHRCSLPFFGMGFPSLLSMAYTVDS